MFIVGLVVGALAGLLMGDFFFRSRVAHPALAVASIGASYVILIVAQTIDQELRVGLAVGLMLGLLLAASPMVTTTQEPI
jgi:hypothetical protein